MKKREINFNQKCVHYSDMSSDSDHQLYLISSLLLKTNDAIEAREAKTLGLLLNKYFNDKLVLDHIFWERSVDFLNLNTQEMKKKVTELKKSI